VNSSLEASETGEASDEEMDDAEFESGSVPRRVRSMDPDKMRRILGIQQQELSAAAQVANVKLFPSVFVALFAFLFFLIYANNILLEWSDDREARYRHDDKSW